jgi:YVTN family beta-propeller protein
VKCLTSCLGQSTFPAMNLQSLLCITLFACICVCDLVVAETAAARTSALLVVANKGDQTISLVDPVAGRQIATVPEDGVTGHEVAASPDGQRAFVPIYGSSGVGRAGSDGRLIRVIDLASRQVVGTVDFGKGVRPHCAVFGPKNGLLYVTTELDNTVTVIDPQTLKIVDTIPTGQPESHMLAITRDGRRGYTANVGPGTVSVLDIVEKKVVTVIPISRTTQRISLSVDDRWAFTADQTKPQLAVIDTATNQIKTWVPLPANGADARWALVAGGAQREQSSCGGGPEHAEGGAHLRCAQGAARSPGPARR